MSNFVRIKNKIDGFNKNLSIDGDKSLSIRWALLSSQSLKKCKSSNLLLSEDVYSTLDCLKKLGVKIKISKRFCEIIGLGLNGFKYKNNSILDAGNSGTLGRLILGLLVHQRKRSSLKVIKFIKRFYECLKPLEKFGAKFKSNFGKLPIEIRGSNYSKPIKYFENRGSAQLYAVMFAALNTQETVIKAKIKIIVSYFLNI